MVNLKSDLELSRLFNSWPAHHWEFSLLVCHPSRFIEPPMSEILERYAYCQKWNVPPFEGGFDKQPKWWRESVKVIEMEMPKAIKYLEARRGK